MPACCSWCSVCTNRILCASPFHMRTHGAAATVVHLYVAIKNISFGCDS